MHTVWTLRGLDGATPASEVMAALQDANPDAALAALRERDVESEDWDPKRAVIARETRDSGLSLRAIARHLHVSQATVARGLAVAF